MGSRSGDGGNAFLDDLGRANVGRDGLGTSDIPLIYYSYLASLTLTFDHSR